MNFFKKIIPDSFSWLMALFLAGFLLLAQVFILPFFLSEAHLARTEFKAMQISKRIADTINILEKTPLDDWPYMMERVSHPRFIVNFNHPIKPKTATFTKLENSISTYLKQELDIDWNIVVVAKERLERPGKIFFDRDMPRFYDVRVFIEIEDDLWLDFAVPISIHRAAFKMKIISYFGLIIGLMCILIVFVVRKSVKPFLLFAKAAKQIEIDPTSIKKLPIKGPKEVKTASLAFNAMQFRIKELIETRSVMLAAISHDLRTPLTRLRLRAEFIEDETQRLKMLNDLSEMEQMISNTISFAKQDVFREEVTEFDLNSLLNDVVSGFKKAEMVKSENCPIKARKIALKRAFSNLIDNAIKYGGRAEISLNIKKDEYVEVIIDDDGNGFNEDEYDNVFKPFYRVEKSRNRETGGAGLGLSIVRNAIQAHAGKIEFLSLKTKGFRVRVILPWVIRDNIQ